MTNGNDLYNMLDKEPWSAFDLCGTSGTTETYRCTVYRTINRPIKQTRDTLAVENEQLRRELKEERAKPKRRQMSSEQAERHRQAMRDYYARIRQEAQAAPIVKSQSIPHLRNYTPPHHRLKTLVHVTHFCTFSLRGVRLPHFTLSRFPVYLI